MEFRWQADNENDVPGAHDLKHTYEYDAALTVSASIGSAGQAKAQFTGTPEFTKVKAPDGNIYGNPVTGSPLTETYPIDEPGLTVSVSLGIDVKAYASANANPAGGGSSASGTSTAAIGSTGITLTPRP